MLDERDRAIVDRIQSDFPLAADPWTPLGEELGLDGAEVRQRVARLLETGVLRKLGSFGDTRRLGHTSTLVAARVPEAEVDAVAEAISAFPEVTHNYLRAHSLNLWFTLIAPTWEHIQARAEEIAAWDRVEALHLLPAERMFKVKVDLRVGGGEQRGAAS
jgi:DNA-binding Lrp family transcriptional regulator